MVVFVLAYLRAVDRSRTEAIGIGGLFFGAGAAPRRVQVLLMGSLAVQLVVAIVVAAVRPYTAARLRGPGPMWALGLPASGWRPTAPSPSVRPEPTACGAARRRTRSATGQPARPGRRRAHGVGSAPARARARAGRHRCPNRPESRSGSRRRWSAASPRWWTSRPIRSGPATSRRSTSSSPTPRSRPVVVEFRAAAMGRSTTYQLRYDYAEAPTPAPVGAGERRPPRELDGDYVLAARRRRPGRHRCQLRAGRRPDRTRSRDSSSAGPRAASSRRRCPS